MPCCRESQRSPRIEFRGFELSPNNPGVQSILTPKNKLLCFEYPGAAYGGFVRLNVFISVPPHPFSKIVISFNLAWRHLQKSSPQRSYSHISDPARSGGRNARCISNSDYASRGGNDLQCLSDTAVCTRSAIRSESSRLEFSSSHTRMCVSSRSFIAGPLPIYFRVAKQCLLQIARCL